MGVAVKKNWIVLVSLALAACASNNIYFPSASAGKAADSVISDVWGKGAK